jgi:hypothetical protein
MVILIVIKSFINALGYRCPGFRYNYITPLTISQVFSPNPLPATHLTNTPNRATILCEGYLGRVRYSY